MTRHPRSIPRVPQRVKVNAPVWTRTTSGLLTRLRPLHDASGRITRWIGTSTDIDVRKREESFRETILGILGHDLRNPLSAILTTARLIAKRDPSKAPSPAQVERIVASGERMHRMIEQLLDLTLARIAGGIPVRRSPEPLALAPLVGRIVDEIRGANPDRTIEYHLDDACAVRLPATFRFRDQKDMPLADPALFMACSTLLSNESALGGGALVALYASRLALRSFTWATRASRSPRLRAT